MHISIDNKDALNTFAFSFAKHTNLSANQVKGVLAKIKGFNYTQSFEESLAPAENNEGSKQIDSCIDTQKSYQNYLTELDDNIESETLEFLEVGDKYELSTSDLNTVNDKIRDAANCISYNSKLAEAVALLVSNGHEALVCDIIDIATNAKRSQFVEGVV